MYGSPALGAEGPPPPRGVLGARCSTAPGRAQGAAVGAVGAVGLRTPSAPGAERGLSPAAEGRLLHETANAGLAGGPGASQEPRERCQCGCHRAAGSMRRTLLWVSVFFCYGDEKCSFPLGIWLLVPG